MNAEIKPKPQSSHHGKSITPTFWMEATAFNHDRERVVLLRIRKGCGGEIVSETLLRRAVLREIEGFIRSAEEVLNYAEAPT